MKQSTAIVICALVALTAAAHDFRSPKEISKLGPNYVLDYVSLLQDTLPVIHSSSDCFTYYMPLLTELAAETETQSEACNSTAATDINTSMTNVQTENQELSTNTSSVVTSLGKCSQITDAISQLECYSSLNQDAVRQLQQIANNASISLRAYNQNITEINNELLTCNTQVSSASQVQTEMYYSDLIYCMNNNAVPTTTTVATTTVNPTDATGATDVSGSVAPATVVPTTVNN
ncbi:hypothetical protein ACFFRR_007668 [Megaselia abdita]